jgi:hypothetical protein
MDYNYVAFVHVQETNNDLSEGFFASFGETAPSTIATLADGTATQTISASQSGFAFRTLNFQSGGNPSIETDSGPADARSFQGNAYANGQLSFVSTEDDADCLESLTVYAPLLPAGAAYIGAHQAHCDFDEDVNMELAIKFLGQQVAVGAGDLASDFGFVTFQDDYDADEGMTILSSTARLSPVAGGVESDFCFSDDFAGATEEIQRPNNETGSLDYVLSDIGHNCDDANNFLQMDIEADAEGAAGTIEISITEVVEGTPEAAELLWRGFSAPGGKFLAAVGADGTSMFLAVPLPDTTPNLAGSVFVESAFSTSMEDPENEGTEVSSELCKGTTYTFTDTELTIKNSDTCAEIFKENNLALPHETNEDGSGTEEVYPYTLGAGDAAGTIVIDFGDVEGKGYVSADGSTILSRIIGLDNDSDDVNDPVVEGELSVRVLQKVGEI